MKSNWFVYIVRCKGGSLYTGISTNVSARLAKHNNGTGAKYTRAHKPVVLVWKKQMKSESAARKLEVKIKKLPRSEKLTLIKKTSEK